MLKLGSESRLVLIKGYFQFGKFVEGDLIEALDHFVEKNYRHEQET